MAHDAKTRAKARALYEAGQSTADIAQKFHLGLRTVKGWCKSGGWEKGKAEPKLHQAQTDAAIKAAADAGLTEAKVAAKVVSLMEAEKTVFWQGSRVADVQDNGTQLGAASLGADILRMKGSRLDLTTGGRSLLDEVIDEA